MARATDDGTSCQPRLPAVLAVLILAAGSMHAADSEKKGSWEIGGRLAPQLTVTSYPDNSFFREVVGSTGADAALDARAWFNFNRGRWTLNIDYQFIALYGDRVEYTREFPPEFQVLFQRLPTDEFRLFDLTYVFTDSGKFAALNRLDRLAGGGSGLVPDAPTPSTPSSQRNDSISRFPRSSSAISCSARKRSPAGSSCGARLCGVRLCAVRSWERSAYGRVRAIQISERPISCCCGSSSRLQSLTT